jgi:DNA recombination protein RmuC
MTGSSSFDRTARGKRGVPGGSRMEWVYLLVGLVVGVTLGALVMRLRAGQDLARLRIENARLEAEKEAASEKVDWAQVAREELRETFASVAGEALAANKGQFLDDSQKELKRLVDPLTQALEKMDQEVRSLETKREGAYGSIETHIQTLGQANARLQTTTDRLAEAMRSSKARGRWGELQLRRVVELAGLQNHIDFEEQSTTDQGKPDMLVHLPNGGVLPVDAKTPMDSYLESVEAPPGEAQAKLDAHATALRQRILALSRKEYWKGLEAAQIVVMFVPSESAIAAAFDRDSSIFEFGFEHRVLVTTPVLLLALLRTVAYGWDQHEIAENAHQIADLGRQLYARFLKVLDPIGDMGEKLGKAVDAYNRAIGSLEGRLIPALRRLRESSASSDAVPDLEPIDQAPRLPLDTEEALDENATGPPPS